MIHHWQTISIGLHKMAIWWIKVFFLLFYKLIDLLYLIVTLFIYFVPQHFSIYIFNWHFFILKLPYKICWCYCKQFYFILGQFQRIPKFWKKFFWRVIQMFNQDERGEKCLQIEVGGLRRGDEIVFWRDCLGKTRPKVAGLVHEV